MRRRIVVVAAALAFAGVAVVVARWLAADSSERAQVERLLTAQARGDVAAMVRELDGCDAACSRAARALAARLRAPGDLEIVRYDSSTAHALDDETGPTRVVWRVAGGPGEGLPTVQCVGVRRTGSALTGPRVTLLDLSTPIAREAGC